MDIVYTQPLKELLQITTYFKEQVIVLVDNEKDEKVAKLNKLVPCYLVSVSTPNSVLQKLRGKLIAVMGGSVKANEFAVKIKANFLISPSNSKQFFDLGLAKKLFENNTIVVLMFEELLKLNSFDRHVYLKNYLEVVSYCNLKKTKFFVASGCREPLNTKPLVTRKAIARMLNYSEALLEESFNQEF